MLGLDIGSHSIKAVQLEPEGPSFRLVAAGIVPAPQKGITDSDQDLALVAQAIKKLISDTKITAREVNISLPESQVFTRLVQFPHLTDEEIASAVSWQAESYIPLPTDEVNIDFQIVERRSPQGTEQGSVDVLLVAAPKSLVGRYIRVAALAGLTISSVESELIALSRALAPPNQTVLLVDLGENSTDLAVVKAGQMMLTRSIATGGKAFTRAITKGLSVTPQQGEEYKRVYGLHTKQLEGKVKTVLEPAIRVITDEIKKAILYYRSDLNRSDPVSGILLSGGTSVMPELSSFLVEGVGIEVVFGDPLGRIIKDERITKSFAGFAPLYGVAIGLAMRG